MTPLDNLTAAFECLWEGRMYLLRAQQQTRDPNLTELTREVSAARNRIEAALIELQGQPAHVPAPPKG